MHLSPPQSDKPFGVSTLFSEVLGQCWKLKFVIVFTTSLPQWDWTPVYSCSYWISELPQRMPDPGDKTNLKMGNFSQICLVLCLLRSQWCTVQVEQLSFRLLIWTSLRRLLFPFLSQRNDTVMRKTENYGWEILMSWLITVLPKCKRPIAQRVKWQLFNSQLGGKKGLILNT